MKIRPVNSPLNLTTRITIYRQARPYYTYNHTSSRGVEAYRRHVAFFDRFRPGAFSTLYENDGRIKTRQRTSARRFERGIKSKYTIIYMAGHLRPDEAGIRLGARRLKDPDSHFALGRYRRAAVS